MDQDLMIQSRLNEAWMNAEAFASIYQHIAAGVIPLHLPEVQDLLKKACALVGLEAEQRQRNRERGES